MDYFVASVQCHKLLRICFCASVKVRAEDDAPVHRRCRLDTSASTIPGPVVAPDRHPSSIIQAPAARVPRMAPTGRRINSCSDASIRRTTGRWPITSPARTEGVMRDVEYESAQHDKVFHVRANRLGRLHKIRVRLFHCR